MTSLPYKFYLYQKDRFPVFPLLLGFLPVILSSAAVVSAAKPDLWRLLAAPFASIAYLLHIRIVDEHRDFQHDSLHHKDRPVQTGVISLEELRKIDWTAVFALLAIALALNIYSFGIAMVLLAYTFLAGKEFFLGEKIRRYFFPYNALNLAQMFLLQIFVYSFFTETLPLNHLVITHFLFTGVGAVLFEFLRKIKTPETESAGRDTYTWYFGFTQAIAIYVSLVLLNALLFFKLIYVVSAQPSARSVFSALFGVVFLLGAAIIHWLRRKPATDQLLQFSSLLVYGLFNVIIYLLKI